MGMITNRHRELRGLILSVGAALCLLLGGCGSTSAPPQTQARRFQLKGKVISVDRPQQRILVDHEEIKGFMAAMAMPYPVSDPKLLDVAQPGDQITADVVATDTSVHLENIVVVKKAEPDAPKPGGSLREKLPGEMPPNFEFVNQDGKRVQLSQYHGKAVLLTFIYTRCPLADYCPLATHNFAEVEKALAKTPAAYAKTHLLSISFDSDYDTPEVLRSYSKSFMAKPAYKHWEFVTIPKATRAKVAGFFNLFVNEEDGQIVHSMTTAVIAPDGSVRRWYNSNDWKPADVLADLTQSAAAS
jgi:protein SCO1/2